MNSFISLRNKNRNLIVNALKKSKIINDNFNFIEANKNVRPSWFGIPVYIKNKNNRKKFIQNIEKKGIETRPIISGNFIRQPSVKKYKLLNRVKFLNSDIVNDHGFFIGLPTKKINNIFVKKIIKAFEQSI
jgi:CDP-6-deoxy-D-xylo-4-hexulose-3-dehydrase